MLVDRQELLQIWATVKAAANENVDTPTVLLLASHNVDSIAATAILGQLLEDDGIPYKVVPILDYAELSQVYTNQMISASELRSIFLINCGGILDLMGHLQQALDEVGGDGPRQATMLPHPDCRWYVLDSHRPYALENIYSDEHNEGESNVYVIHDGEPNADLDDIIAQLPILFDASDGEDSDDEDEPDAQRRRVTLGEYSAMSPDSQRDRRRAVKRMSRRYYSSSWHGTAASLLCYSLVQVKRYAALWIAFCPERLAPCSRMPWWTIRLSL